MRRRKLGELRGLAAVSIPDICARPAEIASRLNCDRGSDVYRINDPARAMKGWSLVETSFQKGNPWVTCGIGEGEFSV